MSTKRILFFSPYFYPYISGLTQYPYNLFTRSDLPLQVTCLTFAYDAQLPSEEGKGTALHILRMPFLFRFSKGFISPSSLSFFWRETKSCDLVVVNLPSCEGVFLALIAALTHKPIISLLSCEVSLPFSLLNFFASIVLQCGVFIQLLFSKKIIALTEDYFQSKWIYRLFKHKMEFVLPPIHSSPIDSSYFEKLEKMKKNDTYTVGFCGRIAAEKGVDVLIESVKNIPNCCLFIAGPSGREVAGEQAYFLKISRMLQVEKIPHHFLGVLSGGELCAFYRAIDVLVLPSVNKTEAFGMVQVEAMLQGTPVIASDLPGVRIPILLTKMGILTPPGDSPAIRKAIQTILENKSVYSNKVLRQQTEKLFDNEKTYHKIYKIFCSSSS